MPKVDRGKKVDPRSNFGRKNGPGGPLFSAKSGPSLPKVEKKWTWSSFTATSSTGPFLAREKSGPGPVSLPKSRQVQFWQGKKVDPIQFHCQNPFLAREKSGPGPVSLPESRQVQFWQGEKSGPGPVLLPKSRQVHFLAKGKVDPVQFRCRKLFFP